LRRSQQDRIDVGEVDVGQGHLQRIARPAERAVGRDLLIPVRQREVVHRHCVVGVVDGRGRGRRQLPGLPLRGQAEPL
jgi:hypothetical protein